LGEVFPRIHQRVKLPIKSPKPVKTCGRNRKKESGSKIVITGEVLAKGKEESQEKEKNGSCITGGGHTYTKAGQKKGTRAHQQYPPTWRGKGGTVSLYFRKR